MTIKLPIKAIVSTNIESLKQLEDYLGSQRLIHFVGQIFLFKFNNQVFGGRMCYENAEEITKPPKTKIGTYIEFEEIAEQQELMRLGE